MVRPSEWLGGRRTSIASSTVAAFLGVLDERKENFQFADQVSIRLEDFLGMFHANFGSIQQFVGFADSANCRSREVLSLESYDVDASRTGGKAFGEHVRWNVLQNAR